MKKPDWVIDKERGKRAAAAETVWLFGLHAVRDALLNPQRQKLRLVLTKNAADRLGDAIDRAACFLQERLGLTEFRACPLLDFSTRSDASTGEIKDSPGGFKYINVYLSKD